jgi:hypothetical protein
MRERDEVLLDRRAAGERMGAVFFFAVKGAGRRMTQPSTVTVPPGVLKMLGVAVVSGLAMAGGLVLVLGSGALVLRACAALAALVVVLFLLGMVSRRPRVVLTPEGFTVFRLIGGWSRRWEDVEGRFAAVRVGVTRVVAFRLTAEYKARVGKKPTSLFAGYDEAISGVFRLSMERLAELLNEHNERSRCSPAVSAMGAGTPAPPPPSH